MNTLEFAQAQRQRKKVEAGDGSLYGANPAAGLVADGDGNLYGTATQGGSAQVGTAFEFDRKGFMHVMHNFAGGRDGAYPYAALLLVGNKVYGTTARGGAENWGTVFDISR